MVDTGVITIGAWLGMAAHLQGLEAVVLDMAGLAQKGGAVFSHVQIGPAGQALTSGKIAVGEGDLMLGGDLLVSSHPKTLELLADDAFAVVNTDSPPTADFIHQPNWQVPVGQVNHDIEQALNNPSKQLHRVQAQHLAQLAFGDTVYANALLLGYAWQTGALPLHLQALRRAIELNGVQIEANLRAFDVGRLLAHAPEQAMRLIQSEQAGAAIARTDHESNPALLQRLSAELAQYQNQTYAQAFEQKMCALAAAAGTEGEERPAWWQPMLKAYYRLLAFKDEYEVARLLSDRSWQTDLLGQFDGQAKTYFYFAPTWLKQPEGNGRPRKWRVGPWALPGLRLLARLKGIRGTLFDPFKYSEERKMQQTLVALFESWLLMLHNDPSLLQHNKALMCTLDLFNQVKGFGQVRLESCQRALPLIRANLAQWTTLQANDQSRIKELQTQGDQAL